MKNWIFIKDFYYYKKIDNITFKIKKNFQKFIIF